MLLRELQPQSRFPWQPPEQVRGSGQGGGSSQTPARCPQPLDPAHAGAGPGLGPSSRAKAMVPKAQESSGLELSVGRLGAGCFSPTQHPSTALVEVLGVSGVWDDSGHPARCRDPFDGPSTARSHVRACPGASRAHFVSQAPPEPTLPCPRDTGTSWTPLAGSGDEH